MYSPYDDPDFVPPAGFAERLSLNMLRVKRDSLKIELGRVEDAINSLESILDNINNKP